MSPLENGSMAQTGGLVLMRGGGTAFLACPVWQCHYRLRVTDLGELVEIDASEDSIRRHLAGHTPDEWLRTLRIQGQDRDRWRDTARHAGLCSWCESPRGQCVASWPHGKCCPDCEHGAEPQDEVVARCCALHAMGELATALQELDGDPAVEADWTRKRVAEHLAIVEGEHRGGGHAQPE